MRAMWSALMAPDPVVPYFWPFFEIAYFRYFDLFQKIYYWSKCFGGNVRECFNVRSFDPAPRYVLNSCRKTHFFRQKTRFFGFGSKITNMKLHQPNRIASTKFDFVDVADINRIILIIGHETITCIVRNLGSLL